MFFSTFFLFVCVCYQRPCQYTCSFFLFLVFKIKWTPVKDQSSLLLLLSSFVTSIEDIQYCYRTDPGGGVNDILLLNGPPPSAPGGLCPHTRFALPAARERCLSMPETGEKERNYLFKKLYRLRVMT